MPTKNTQPKSNCCQAELTVIHGDEGTSYYQCGKCERASDPETQSIPVKPETTTDLADQASSDNRSNQKLTEVSSGSIFIPEMEEEIREAYKGIVSDDQIDATIEWWNKKVASIRRSILDEVREKVESLKGEGIREDIVLHELLSLLAEMNQKEGGETS